MSNETRALSPQEISLWIRDAAISEPWRASHRRVFGPVIVPEGSDHPTRVRSLLHRARTKSFVKMIKPFRGLFRNQGAVNDSLIEAGFHLGAQNQEMQEEITRLRDLVASLESQIKRRPEASDRDGSCV